jgi:hypothetical protein
VTSGQTPIVRPWRRLLTERQNSFARREADMAWAAAHGQGAPAAVVERAAAEFLGRPDVHRAPDGSDVRFTTSDLIAHEEAIVGGALARRGEGSGRLAGARRRGPCCRASRAD